MSPALARRIALALASQDAFMFVADDLDASGFTPAEIELARADRAEMARRYRGVADRIAWPASEMAARIGWMESLELEESAGNAGFCGA